MTNNAHPILLEYLEQVPESLQTFQSIQGGEEYADIASKAQSDLLAFRSLDGVLADGRTVEQALKQSGSEETLDNPDALDKDRLRVVGALSMIAEFAEDLAED